MFVDKCLCNRVTNEQMEIYKNAYTTHMQWAKTKKKHRLQRRKKAEEKTEEEEERLSREKESTVLAFLF